MVWNKHHKLVITQANKSPVCGEDEISRTTVFGLWQISDVTYGGGGGSFEEGGGEGGGRNSTTPPHDIVVFYH